MSYGTWLVAPTASTPPRSAIAAARQRYLEREYAPVHKPEVDPVQLVEPTGEQSGNHEKDDAEGHLDRDEGGANPARSAAGADASARVQKVRHVGSERL